MKTIHEAAEFSGVSVRTLHHYDAIGLLRPAAVTSAGYRLYDEASLERLQQILLFRELDFSLSDIKRILDSPKFSRTDALREQIALLTLKKQRLEGLINHANQLLSSGGTEMSFQPFNKETLEKYSKQAKEKWGDTAAYKEFEEKNKGRLPEQQNMLAQDLMKYFEQFGALREQAPESAPAQSVVKELQNYITKHYYQCTDQILAGLGQMYAAGGEMTDNIDAAGGAGTADFAAKAIAHYCKQ